MNVDTKEIMESFKADNLGFVDDVIKDYRSGKGALHIGASIVMFHAIKFGDVRPINRFIRELDHESTEGKKFKMWVGQHTRVKDGEETIPTMGFSVKEVIFMIKPGTHNLRGTLFPDGVDSLIAESEHFLDFRRKSEPKAKDLERILKGLRSALKLCEKQADEHGVVLPPDIKNEIDKTKTKLALFIEA